METTFDTTPASRRIEVPDGAVFDSEADAYEFLERLRWGAGGPTHCPHCGSDKGAWFLKPKDPNGRLAKGGSTTRSHRRVWKCRENTCRRQFSALTNTVMHGTKMPVRVWVGAIVDLCRSKNGVSAREISTRWNVTEKSAWAMLNRIEDAISRAQLDGENTLAGAVKWLEVFNENGAITAESRPPTVPPAGAAGGERPRLFAPTPPVELAKSPVATPRERVESAPVAAVEELVSVAVAAASTAPAMPVEHRPEQQVSVAVDAKPPVEERVSVVVEAASPAPIASVEHRREERVSVVVDVTSPAPIAPVEGRTEQRVPVAGDAKPPVQERVSVVVDVTSPAPIAPVQDRREERVSVVVDAVSPAPIAPVEGRTAPRGSGVSDALSPVQKGAAERPALAGVDRNGGAGGPEPTAHIGPSPTPIRHDRDGKTSAESAADQVKSDVERALAEAFAEPAIAKNDAAVAAPTSVESGRNPALDTPATDERRPSPPPSKAGGWSEKPNKRRVSPPKKTAPDAAPVTPLSDEQHASRRPKKSKRKPESEHPRRPSGGESGRSETSANDDSRPTNVQRDSSLSVQPPRGQGRSEKLENRPPSDRVKAESDGDHGRVKTSDSERSEPAGTRRDRSLSVQPPGVRGWSEQPKKGEGTMLTNTLSGDAIEARSAKENDSRAPGATASTVPQPVDNLANGQLGRESGRHHPPRAEAPNSAPTGVGSAQSISPRAPADGLGGGWLESTTSSPRDNGHSVSDDQGQLAGIGRGVLGAAGADLNDATRPAEVVVDPPAPNQLDLFSGDPDHGA